MTADLPAQLVLDTNILVRYITGDTPAHTAAAVVLLQRAANGETLLRLSSVVVAEAVFVLTSFYGLPRLSVAEVLLAFLELPGVRVEEKATIVTAFAVYKQRRRLHFVDCYVAAKASGSGWSVASFDAGIAKLQTPGTVDPSQLDS